MSQLSDLKVDIAIAGGGPVGSALALALAPQGYTVTLLNPPAPGAPDLRPLALSYGSRLILERLGVWSHLAPDVTAIQTIHVSQRGGFGRVNMRAAEIGVPELGYVVPYQTLLSAITLTLADNNANILAAQMTHWKAGEVAQVDYSFADQAQSLSARMLVLADGGSNELEGHVKTYKYQQVAITARVVSRYPHQARAFERFTVDGPLALLPFGTGWALVWTTSEGRAAELSAVSDAEFLAALRIEFGSRVGEFTAVSDRAAYPLRRREFDAAPTPVLRIGNAAQTLHPVAGQGFNLGLRDAWFLAQHGATSTLRLGSSAWIQAYLEQRQADRRASLDMTHSLVQWFGIDQFAVRQARGLGLQILGMLPPLKRHWMRKLSFGQR